MAATAVRERVFILAASKDQADIFARRWVAEAPETRRLVDARYLHGNTPGLSGLYIGKDDRLVCLDGAGRHPRAGYIVQWLKRTLAKSGRSLDAIEHVAL